MTAPKKRLGLYLDPENIRDQTLLQQFTAYHNQSQNSQISDDLKDLLELGLKVTDGQYHDHELQNLENQVKNLNLTAETQIQLNKSIIQGLADIQDAITGQISDVDALVTKTTQQSAPTEPTDDLPF